MLERLILAAPAGATRERLEAFFAPRVERLLVLAREEAVRGGRLVIEDEQARWDGEALLAAPAAVVLDSGFMWPVPRLAPDEETWNAFRGRFDEYLRDERETASLWLSLMEVLTDRLPRVINPQPTFAHAALKPAALDRLRAAGVGTVPQLDSNDPDAVAAFAEAHPGPLLSLPVGDLPGPARWVAREALAELPLDQEPVCLQAPLDQEARQVVVVDGAAVVVDGGADLAGLAPEMAAVLPGLCSTLELGFGEVTFRRSAGGWAVSDFDPAPDVGAWVSEVAETALEALWQALLGSAAAAAAGAAAGSPPGKVSGSPPGSPPEGTG
jgi:hypothetical protein